jgi:hypothetical protein
MDPARSETRVAPEKSADALPAVEPQAPAQEPPWLEEMLKPVRAFLETAWAFLRNPARFSREWVSGQQQAMNPLAFIGASTALLIFALRATSALAHRTHPPSFFSDLLLALAPQLYYAQLGLVVHWVLRLFGSRRRWTSSVGVALFAGGIFPLVAMLLALGVALGVHFTVGLPTGVSALKALPSWARLVVALLIGGAFSAFLFTLAMGLGAMHRVNVARMAVALFTALIVTGLLARVAPLPTMQLVVVVSHAGSIPIPRFDLKF